jgi:hypothetical protein
MSGTSIFSNGQTININGQIKDAETGTPIENAKEVLINPLNDSRLDSTYTNLEGLFDMIYVWNDIKENNNLVIDKLYPNPYTSQAELNLILLQDKQYKIMAFDSQGRMLLEKDQFLTKGLYDFHITGGQAGINFFVITDGEKKATYKGLQTTSTGRPLDIQVSQLNTTPSLKSTLDEILMIGDLAKLESSKPGYYTKDTIWTLQANQTINLNLQKIPITYGFNAIALNHLDTATTNVAIKILWSDGVETIHYGQNGLIDAHRTTTQNLSDTIYITNADTTIYSNWLWARTQENPLNQANLFQSTKADGLPPEASLATLSTLLDTFNLFVQVKEVPDPLNPGQYIRTDSETFLGFVAGNTPFKSIRYTFAPQVIDSIDNFRMMRVETSTGQGELVSPELFEQMCSQQDSALALFRLPYGIDLLPPIRTENVNDRTTNQRYISAQARDFDQSIITLYSNNLVTPGIYTITPTNLYTIIVNGEPTVRIKRGTSQFQQDATTGTIRAEQIGQLMNGDDVNGGGATPYLVGPNGENTEFAKVAAYTVYISNPGTYLYQLNKK